MRHGYAFGLAACSSLAVDRTHRRRFRRSPRAPSSPGRPRLPRQLHPLQRAPPTATPSTSAAPAAPKTSNLPATISSSKARSEGQHYVLDVRLRAGSTVGGPVCSESCCSPKTATTSTTSSRTSFQHRGRATPGSRGLRKARAHPSARHLHQDRSPLQRNLRQRKGGRRQDWGLDEPSRLFRQGMRDRQGSCSKCQSRCGECDCRELIRRS